MKKFKGEIFGEIWRFPTVFSGRNLPVDTLERLEVNREMLALGFIAQSQVRTRGPQPTNRIGYWERG